MCNWFVISFPLMLRDLGKEMVLWFLECKIIMKTIKDGPTSMRVGIVKKAQNGTKKTRC